MARSFIAAAARSLRVRARIDQGEWPNGQVGSSSVTMPPKSSDQPKRIFRCKKCGTVKKSGNQTCPNALCATHVTTPPEHTSASDLDDEAPSPKQPKILSDADLAKMQAALDKKDEAQAIVEVTTERDNARKELDKYKKLYRDLMEKNAKTNGELDAANKRIERLSSFIQKNFADRMSE